MNELTYPTEAAVISEIARDSQRYGAVHVPDSHGVHLNVLRNGERIDVAGYESYDKAPRRARGVTVVNDIDSFVALMTMPDHQGSVIFADRDRSTFNAIINYTGWRDHRITLELKTSEAFARWSMRNSGLYGQSDFAEMIEEGIGEIASPAAADMLEIAQTFSATKNVDFESGVRQSSGEVRFRYTERIEAIAGAAKDIKVPEKFTVRMPVWIGGPVVEMHARLRHRLSREGLLLGYKIDAMDEVVRAAFGEVHNTIVEAMPAEQYQYTMVRGRCPMIIDPLP